MASKFIEAANAVDRAISTSGTEREMADIMNVLRFKEQIQIAMTNAALSRSGGSDSRKEERLPLRDDGDDFGRVEARIPANLFYGLKNQRNFGLDGFTSNEGMRDFAKAYPQFMCKTVSGKITVGYGSKSSRKRIRWGRNTMTFSK